MARRTAAADWADAFVDRGMRREGDTERPLGPRAIKTRTAILAAAVERFAACGYQATTMADIATAAGVSLGTVYQYFRDRADLIAALVRGNLAHRLTVDDVGWRAADGRAGLQRVLTNFVASYAAVAELAGVWEEVAHIEPQLAELRRRLGRRFTDAVGVELANATKAGLVRRGLDADLVSRALTAMADRFCYVTYVFDPPAEGPPAPAAAAAVLTDLWADAIGLVEA